MFAQCTAQSVVNLSSYETAGPSGSYVEISMALLCSCEIEARLNVQYGIWQRSAYIVEMSPTVIHPRRHYCSSGLFCSLPWPVTVSPLRTGSTCVLGMPGQNGCPLRPAHLYHSSSGGPKGGPHSMVSAVHPSSMLSVRFAKS